MEMDVEIQKRLKTDRRQIISDISDLVKIESPSGDFDNLKKCSDFLVGLIKERTGVAPEVITSDETRIILAEMGTDRGSGAATMVCHYDTVHPVGSLERNPVAVHGEKMTGPGIFDMKSGVIIAIWGLKYLKDLGLLNRRINLVITADEEIGSDSSKDLLIRLSKDSSLALVLEPSADGMLKVGRKGVGTFTVTARGIASHAGLDPDKGANAISELARLIPKIESFQNRKLGTTVSVGTVRGGTTSNVVPDFAEAVIDVRARTLQEAERIENAFGALDALDPRIFVSVSGSMDRPPMESSGKNMKAFELVRDIGSKLGIDLQSCEVGGGSDGNFISAEGVPVVDGFGAVGAGAHSVAEYILVDETLARIRLLAAVLCNYP